ncbi:hypothetical protein MBLNU230_g3616t1 [Neophaeotheca triangularis]
MADKANDARIEHLIAREQTSHSQLASFLDRIQQTSPEDLTADERSRLVNFDRTAIRECNAELTLMENVEDPTPEQKRLAKELDRLVSLLDEVVSRALVLRDEKLGPDCEEAEVATQGSDTPENAGIDEPHRVPGDHLTATDDAAGKSSAADQVAPGTSQQVKKGNAVDEMAAKIASTNVQEAAEPALSTGPPKPRWTWTRRLSLPMERDDRKAGPDPLGLYAELEVARDAPLSVIHKAVKKKLILIHPNRFPEESDEVRYGRYAEYNMKFRVFDTREGREDYDRIKTVGDIDTVMRKYP